MFDVDDNEVTIEDIEDFLNGDGADTSSANEEESHQEDAPETGEKKETETQAFAHRLKEATTKAINKEREVIAKSLGYESYSEMQKAREQELLRENGLDPEDVSPVVEKLVEKRLAEDPRLQELGDYRKQKVNEWAKKELAELTELTNGKIKTLSDVPQNVIELWKTKGSLKGAYLELEGEGLIREMRTSIASEQSKGSTGHMASPAGNPIVNNGNKRPLTEKEREIYKLFNPNVTEEQLSKMLKDK